MMVNNAGYSESHDARAELGRKRGNDDFCKDASDVCSVCSAIRDRSVVELDLTKIEVKVKY